MTVKLYTDGACSGNPGPGGWGVVVHSHGEKKELYGGELETTNNRMEMCAAIKGIESIDIQDELHVYTDSSYLKDGITCWVKKWQANGWKTANKNPVKNQDLWERLSVLCADRKIKWYWIKGHNGHLENERADFLARHGLMQQVMKGSMNQ